MKSKITKTVAALLALVALALGGSAIASAMNDNQPAGSGSSGQIENENGPEGLDDADHGTEANSQGEANDQGEAGDQGEANDQGEATDAGESVSAADAVRAKAAAEAQTGGTARAFFFNAAAAPEKGDSQDPAEAVSPSGAAFEVDVTKGSRELKVYLNSQFQVLSVQQDS